MLSTAAWVLLQHAHVGRRQCGNLVGRHHTDLGCRQCRDLCRAQDTDLRGGQRAATAAVLSERIAAVPEGNQITGFDVGDLISVQCSNLLGGQRTNLGGSQVRDLVGGSKRGHSGCGQGSDTACGQRANVGCFDGGSLVGVQCTDLGWPMAAKSAEVNAAIWS